MADRAEVRLTRTFKASAGRVYDAWLNPDSAAAWLVAGMGELSRVEIDPRPGGGFRFDQRRKDRTLVHRGEYLELDRPGRLTFTWTVEGLEGESVVSVRIEPLASGSRLTLVHRLIGAHAERPGRVEEQWRAELAQMGRILS